MALLCATLLVGCAVGPKPTPDGDWDGDGISNQDEGYRWSFDADGDGIENWLDLDSDADGVPDYQEAGDRDLATPPADRNGNSVFDFLDPDYPGEAAQDGGVQNPVPDPLLPSGDGDDADGDQIPNRDDDDDDGDGIPDAVEERGQPGLDSDGDGKPNRLDLDSDNDGIPDAVEGHVDTDEDRSPDFLDTDSDADGLSDAEEDLDADGVVAPCAAATPCESSRTDDDTDDDGITDLVEKLAQTDPTDANSRIPREDFYFVLPYQAPPQHADLKFSTKVGKADIFFSIDSTGSFDAEIEAIQESLTDLIIPGLRSIVTDAAFGVGTFADFPVAGFAQAHEVPFRLVQPVTEDQATMAAAMARVKVTSNGGDEREAGLEAVYQWATGAGIPSVTGTPQGDPIPPFMPGQVGGAGFRDDALPVIVHITDAASHDPLDYLPHGIEANNYHRTLNALNAIGARFIGVRSKDEITTDDPRYDPLPELTGLAMATDATVPPNAEGLCPVGPENQTRAPIPDAKRRTVCPLVFDVRPNGTGLALALVDAVRQLASHGRLDISTSTTGKSQSETGELLPASRSTSDFLLSITPQAPTPAGATIDGDVFRDVTAGIPATFRLEAQNTFIEPADELQLFTLQVRVWGDAITLLDQRTVYVVVPRKPPPVDVPLI